MTKLPCHILLVDVSVSVFNRSVIVSGPVLWPEMTLFGHCKKLSSLTVNVISCLHFQRHELRPPSVSLHSGAASRKLCYLVECNCSEHIQRLDWAIVWVFNSCQADFVGTYGVSVTDASMCDILVRWCQYL